MDATFTDMMHQALDRIRGAFGHFGMIAAPRREPIVSTCPHFSFSGIDQTMGPCKEWECDGCGRRHFDVEDPSGEIHQNDGRGWRRLRRVITRLPQR